MDSHILSTFSLFHKIPDAELKQLWPFISHAEIKAKQIFIHQEESAEKLYLIVSGSVRIFRLTESGEEVHISVKGKGELIGEMSLIDNKPRSANVETIQDTVLLTINKQDFLTLLKDHSQIGINLLNMFAQRLRETDTYVESVLSTNLKERTWIVLLSLSHHFDNNDILLSQEELAAIIGATRARVTEVLNLLAKEGKITIEHRKIHIVP